MKTKTRTWIGLVASGLLLVGCVAPKHSAAWEYKAVSTPIFQDGKVSEADYTQFLNQKATNGWGVVSTQILSTPNEMHHAQFWVILKRGK